MIKHLLFFLFPLFCFSQTHDSIVKRTVTVTHDSLISVTHDSTYFDTIQVPDPVVMLKGMYTHPNQVTIGSASSENSYLSYCKGKGVNMLNLYARSYLYTSDKRAQLAAFVTKAKSGYGIILVTVDVRFTNSSEEPGWNAYFASYSGTPAMIEPLTEKEPWIYDKELGRYDYSGTFNMLRKMSALCKKYNVKFNFYEGWMGNNYNGAGTFSQAPVDSMVKYCDRIFLSNYVKVADYTSTSTSLGEWDNRMDKRCSTIAVACPRVGKTLVEIVEIISLERIAWGAGNDFLGTYFACPETSVNKCNSFYGSTYQEGLNEYNKSSAAVLQYTNVIGRTMFYSKYAKLAQP